MILAPQKVLHLKDELKKKNPKLSGKYLITPKLDGWWVAIPFNNRKFGNPISSNGREIPAFEWFKNESFNDRLIAPTQSGFLIAEAFLPDTPFKILNGIFNKSVGDYHCYDVEFHVHDMVYTSLPNKTATERYQEVVRFVEYLRYSNNVRNIYNISTEYSVDYNEDVWKSIFDRFILSNYEGLVAKKESSIYLPGKRNSDLLKLKLEMTLDLQAVRLERSIGEKGNEALTLISKRKNGVEIKTVIAAFKDQAKFKELEETSKLTSTVVEIKAMEEFEDGQLRQPVFKWIRENKTISEID